MSNRRIWKSLQETLEKEHRKELRAAKKNRTVNWDFARNAVKSLESNVASDLRALNFGLCRYSENYSHPEGKFWKIFEFLMNSFDTMNLPDTTIAADLLRLAYYSMLFEESSLPELATYLIRAGYDLCIQYQCGIPTIEEFQTLLKAAYSGSHDWVRNHLYYHQVVWHFITEGREKILSSLLRYGVMFLPIPDDDYYVTPYLLYDIGDMTPPQGWTYCDIDFRNKRKWIVTRVMKLLAVELQTESRTCGPMPKDDTLSRSVYFRCLQRTFETIPEPFVTSDEIRCYLREMLGIYLDEESELHIDRLIAEFEDVYPEGMAVPSPRSLKHLSRCQVRENLRQSGTLPHGIRELELPRNVEKYIILE